MIVLTISTAYESEILVNVEFIKLRNALFKKTLHTLGFFYFFLFVNIVCIVCDSIIVYQQVVRHHVSYK